MGAKNVKHRLLEIAKWWLLTAEGYTKICGKIQNCSQKWNNFKRSVADNGD